MNLSVRRIAAQIDSMITVNWWIIGGFSIFLGLLLSAGFIGIYSLKNAEIKSQQEAEAIDLARESQIEFQKQFFCWKNAVIGSGRSDEFRENYHAFSRHASRVQDLLFNLKSMNSDDVKMHNRVSELIDKHRKVTADYITLLVSYEETHFKNRGEIMSRAGGHDTDALDMMEDIARRIMEEAGKRRANADEYYGKLVMSSFLGIAFSALLMSIVIGWKIISMNANLESLVKERTEELEIANRDISLSEEKYRVLVEGTNDMVFSLDDSLSFITYNRALTSQLQMKDSDVSGKSFYSILYQSGDNRINTREMIGEKLKVLLSDKKSISFTTDFQAKLLSEPKEYNVRLEYITIDGGGEIIGRATPTSSYSVFEKLHYERKRFSIGNYLGSVDDVTHHLTRNLHDYVDAKEIVLVRLALREILFNAIEHGNLSITFEEKSSAIMEDGYFALIHARQNDPRYSDRKVTIEYQIDDKKITYLVTDEGQGFDYKKVMAQRNAANSDSVPNGRGITMAMNIFSSVKYNRKGNSVIIEKHFDRISEGETAC